MPAQEVHWPRQTLNDPVQETTRFRAVEPASWGYASIPTAQVSASNSSFTSNDSPEDTDSGVKFEKGEVMPVDDADSLSSSSPPSVLQKPRSTCRRQTSPPKRQERIPHRLIERNYREGLNSRFDALRDIVPGPSRLKTTKAGVLAAAISHIRQLEMEKSLLQNELQAVGYMGSGMNLSTPNIPMPVTAPQAYWSGETVMIDPAHCGIHGWRPEHV